VPACLPGWLAASFQKILCWDKLDTARRIYDLVASVIYTEPQLVFTSHPLASFIIKGYFSHYLV
jgi:hypothetical protein